MPSMLLNKECPSCSMCNHQQCLDCIIWAIKLWIMHRCRAQFMHAEIEGMNGYV